MCSLHVCLATYAYYSYVADEKIFTTFAVGIPVVVNLPGVGNNLQDHPASVIVYKLKPGLESLDDLSHNASALDAVRLSRAQILILC